MDKPAKPRSLIALFASGFLMGLADLIPGISGGTVAFILGIWEELILSIKNVSGAALAFVMRKKGHESAGVKSLLFLGPVLLGIGLAILLFTKAVDQLLNNPVERVYLYSAFFGLIIASCVLCLSKISSWSRPRYMLFFISAAAAFYLTNAKPGEVSGQPLYTLPLDKSLATSATQPLNNYDRGLHRLTGVDETTLAAMKAKGIISSDQTVIDETTGTVLTLRDISLKKEGSALNFWVIFCGAAAISAMLLPGISGSFLLVVLGMYPTVIGNVADFINALQNGHLDWGSCLFLLQFALGILLGAACFSKVIGALFERYHDNGMALVAGFVAGSLGVVWPFWSYGYVLDPIKIEKGARLIAVEPIIPGFQEMAHCRFVIQRCLCDRIRR
ncbi:DUF368 domain-containing protein [Estrella lausannensis]|uniref:Conserved putative membrane protein n=1 Tax=Estrella lausannensis TaxID=483423 RepID=A0A0H5E7X5_9BACT|nr:DUF368 domain-containing protein [Estrella lausannensis]CRX39440.1 Conserved putative membrane protein [Estrella lausannensis]